MLRFFSSNGGLGNAVIAALDAAAIANDVVCAYAMRVGVTARLIETMQKSGKTCTQLVETVSRQNKRNE